MPTFRAQIKGCKLCDKEYVDIVWRDIHALMTWTEDIKITKTSLTCGLIANMTRYLSLHDIGSPLLKYM